MADITSGLVAHWKLDETSGTSAADSSGNGHTGTYVNTPTLNQTGAFGSSKAVTFASASSQYVSLGLKSASATNQTIAFWFNASDLSGTRNVLGWGKNEVRVSPTAVRYYADNDTAGGINWATTFNAGTWYHVVVSHSGTSATIYVNGVSLGSQTVVALDTGSFTSSLAAYNAASNYFSGTLDDVRIYSRALSAGDVAKLFRYGADITSNLVAHWKLDETSGNANDVVGGLVLTDVNSVGTAVGQIGNARDFESSTPSYLTMADHATVSFGDTNFTVATWFKLESDVFDKTILSHFGAAGQRSYKLWVDAGLDRVRWSASGDGTATTTVTANTFGEISVGNWYLAVGEHDAASNLLKVSVNGGAFDTAVFSAGLFNSTVDFRVGYGADGAMAFDGLIDEVRLYNRALSAADVAELYAYTGARFTTLNLLLPARYKKG